MTRKEQIQMEKLRQENQMLRAEIDKHFGIYRETLIELVEAQARLEAIKFAMEDE